MFRGVNSINLDAKGRLAIPTRYRAELLECCDRQMIVTLAVNEKGSGKQGCLWLYPLPEWEELEQKINKLPTINKMAGKLRRFVIGYATECEMDAQGRLLISERLRKIARLEKHIILMGQLNKFEIWNEEIFTIKENEWLSSDDAAGAEGDDTEGLEALGNLSF